MKKIILSLLIFLSFGFLNNTFADEEVYSQVGDGYYEFFTFSSKDKTKAYYCRHQLRTCFDENKQTFYNDFPSSYSTFSFISSLDYENGKIFFYGEGNSFFVLFYNSENDTFTYSDIFNIYEKGYKSDFLVNSFNGKISLKVKYFGHNNYFEIDKNLKTVIEKSSLSSNIFIKLNPNTGGYVSDNFVLSFDKTLKKMNYLLSNSSGLITNFIYDLNFSNFQNILTYKIIVYNDKIILSLSEENGNGYNFSSCSDLKLENGKINCNNDKLYNDKYINDYYNEKLYYFKSNNILNLSNVSLFGMPFSILSNGENIIKYYVDKNQKLYSTISSNFISLNYGTSGTSTKKCEKILLSYPYNIPYLNSSSIVIGNDDIDNENNRAQTTIGKSNSGYESYITLKNIEGLTNFSGSGILNNDPFTFNPLNSISRWTGFGDKPIMILSANQNIGYFKIDGSGPSSEIYGNVVDCDDGKRILGIETLEYGKTYTIEETGQICIDFGNKVGDRTINSIQFGGLGSQRFEREVCTKGDKTYIDGELFEGDLDNPGDRNLINQIVKNKKDTQNKAWYERIGDFIIFILSLFSPPDLEGDYTENKFYKFSISILEKIPGLGDMLSIINVSLPETPILNIDLPFIDISTSGKIGYQTVNSDLPIITDRLNISSIQKNEDGSKFISFILAILYILIRILLFGFLFYLLKLFWKFTQYITSTFFGGLLSKDGKGNLISAFIFSGVIILIIGTLFSIFTYIAPILPFISALADYTTILFSYFALSFFDYLFFAGIVNLFFGSITTIILIYIAYLLVITFARAN